MRKRLNSSHVNAMDYDPEAAVLLIEFNDGSTYLYSEVPQRTADGLAQSFSPGSYFRSFIKGKFAYERR